MMVDIMVMHSSMPVLLGTYPKLPYSMHITRGTTLQPDRNVSIKFSMIPMNKSSHVGCDN